MTVIRANVMIDANGIELAMGAETVTGTGSAEIAAEIRDEEGLQEMTKQLVRPAVSMAVLTEAQRVGVEVEAAMMIVDTHVVTEIALTIAAEEMETSTVEVVASAHALGARTDTTVPEESEEIVTPLKVAEEMIADEMTGVDGAEAQKAESKRRAHRRLQRTNVIAVPYLFNNWLLV